MARSFSNAKLLSVFVVDRISVALSRRGFAAAASEGGVSGSERGVVMANKGGKETTKKTSSWIPDPVTGYYRPENHAKEIDVAELRDLLLKNNNIRRH